MYNKDTRNSGLSMTSESNQPLVYGIVLNWNGYEDTVSCLDSLRQMKYDNFRIVVVDNGSEDGSGSRLDNEYQNVDVLFNRENRGFAGGMNTGIRFAIDSGADYVWVLNNDTVVPSDSNPVSHLIAPLMERPDIGITSPVILKHDTNLVWFWKAEVNSYTLNAKHVNQWEELDDFSKKTKEVMTGYIPLCAAMIDVDVINDVGLLNEQYFLYYEDVDFSMRVKKHGYELLTRTDTEVEHKVSQSTGSNLDPLNSYYAARNRILFRREIDGTNSKIYFIISYLIWLVLLTGHRIIHRKGEGLLALLRGTWDGIRSRTGKGPYP
ncbi:glycosyltransferase family 2 protein [Natrinema soli]|uniref:Glycosyltransferase family 2 protein n=1 Tax=Natrinema soli TaxID=1930624 RepID=A0ABD5SQK2_9EURY|nr:glycosyltransferase family 2 protein [Natrinema soli]